MDGLNLVIHKGDLIGILGPKCSGKTTLLKMIAGLETPITGDIYIDGVKMNDMEPIKRRVAYISSNYKLFRFMTVYENISMSMEYKDVIKTRKDSKVLEVLRMLDLKGLENLYPHMLTEEEKKLVVVAREVVTNPKLLLFDEPFINTAKELRIEIRKRVHGLITQLGIPGMMVLNSNDELMSIANRIIIIRNGRRFGECEMRA